VKKLLDLKIFLKFCKNYAFPKNLKEVNFCLFQGDDKPLGGGGELKPQLCAVRTSLSCKVGRQSPSL
jgi:hypothetical protein